MTDFKHREKDSDYDGVPEYIREMSDEELNAFIKAETERLAIINKDIKD